MPSDANGDDREARRARANAIRRKRDKRNENLNVPADPAEPPAEPQGSNDALRPADSTGEPNYVDFIDRKMRQPKKKP
jgi:hypothetical protein